MNFSNVMEMKIRRRNIMNKYHFSLHLQFEKDCDVDKIEKELGMKAYKKNSLSESKGENKTAKIWFKTENVENSDTYEMFERTLNGLKDKLEIIKKANQEYSGKTVFTLYFEKLTEKPYIRLSSSDMELLSNNGISFEVDFRI